MDKEDTQSIEVYYFGCIEQPGHYFFDEHGSRRYSDVSEIVGGNIWPHIDGGFCPGMVPGAHGSRRTRPEIEGEAALHYVDGWTILAFWDRSVDTRGACNSNFVARGKFDFHQMVSIAEHKFPKVIERVLSKYTLKLVENYMPPNPGDYVPAKIDASVPIRPGGYLQGYADGRQSTINELRLLRDRVEVVEAGMGIGTKKTSAN